MAAGIIAPALPELSEAFADTNHSDFLSKLVLSITAIFIAISAPLAGRFIDKHGRLKLLYAALLLYVISGSSGYFLNSIYHILIGRAVLGIAIGLVMTITITLIGDYFEGEERKSFIGYQAAFIGFAGIVFVQIGGFMADISWRLPFLIYLLPLVLIPLGTKFLHEPSKSVISISAAQVEVDWLIKILFANAIILMILFYIVPTQLPFFLQDIGIGKKMLVGLALGINALGMVVASLLYSRLKGIMHFPYIYSFGFILMAVGYLIIGTSPSFAVVLLAVFIAGLGIGILWPNTNFWVIELTKPESRGKTLGVLTTCLFLGQFLSPIVFEPLVKGFGLSFLFTFASVIMIGIALGFLGLSRSLINMDNANKN